MTSSDRLRYARQMTLDAVGDDGQALLRGASVIVVGAGGLGSPVLHHLVASGVGTVGIVEFDVVDVSNIHRQTLYSTDNVGIPKIEAASERLHAVNPDVDLVLHRSKLVPGNADSILKPYDIVVDGSDTFATRYAVNDAAIRLGIPVVYASVSQFSGQASVLGHNNGPCYRCLFPEPPPAGLVPSCEEGGVLGVVPSLLGTVQAAETLKLILGIGKLLAGRLMMIDALTMEVREIQFERDPDCPACGERRRPTRIKETPEVTALELRGMMDGATPPTLVDVREASERTVGDLDGRLIPLGMLDVRAFELDDVKDRDVVVFCAAGGRSAQAVRMLRDRGFNAVSLRGGMQTWHATQSSA